MKRTLLIGSLLAAALLPVAAANAHGVSVSVNTPDFGIRIGAPIYRPVPVYAPPPVVYAPAPVFYTPPPRVIYAPPRVVYRPYPYYAGVRVAPVPYGHWKHKHRDSHRHDRHDDDRHHRDYRAGYGF